MKAIRQSTFVMIRGVCLLMVIAAAGKSAAQYEMSRFTIDGGGRTSAGGPYTLVGTAGQPDAGRGAGGSYQLFGGFWPAGPVCPCMGDLNGDDWLSPADVSSLVSQLLPFASVYYWTEAASDSCGDMNQDGWLSADDVGFLVSKLLPYKSAYYWKPCE